VSTILPALLNNPAFTYISKQARDACDMPSALCSLLGTGAFAYVYLPLNVTKNLHAIVIYFRLVHA
jgi:hypothetical protein